VKPGGDSPLTLYPRLLGASWHDLDEAVRQAHYVGKPVRSSGWLQVRHGSGWLARLLVWLLRMPLAGDAVRTRLVVTPQGKRERWQRSFGARFLVTTQWEESGNLLAERMGPLEIYFRLHATNRALVYRQTGAALRLGPWRLDLPSWLAPRVVAQEEPGGHPERIHVAVEIVAPLLGLLISYDGAMVKEG